MDPFEPCEKRIKELEAVLADVATAFDCKPDDHTDLIEAARLLKREAAAAPELLAALKGMMEKFGSTVEPGEAGTDAVEAAVIAIHKAEGRTN